MQISGSCGEEISKFVQNIAFEQFSSSLVTFLTVFGPFRALFGLQKRHFGTKNGSFWGDFGPFWVVLVILVSLCFGVVLASFGVVLVSPCPHFEAFWIFFFWGGGCFEGCAPNARMAHSKAAQRETRRGAKKAQMSGFDQYRWKTFLFRPGTWFRHFLRKPTGERPFFPSYFSIFWAPL